MNISGTEPIWHTVPYICGNDRNCLKRQESAVQMAKNKIDSKYVVVGLLEQLKVIISTLKFGKYVLGTTRLIFEKIVNLILKI
jgi:hypothetical protein